MTACNLVYGLMVDDFSTIFTDKQKLRAHIDEVLNTREVPLDRETWGLYTPKPLKDRIIK